MILTCADAEGIMSQLCDETTSNTLITLEEETRDAFADHLESCQLCIRRFAEHLGNNHELRMLIHIANPN